MRRGLVAFVLRTFQYVGQEIGWGLHYYIPTAQKSQFQRESSHAASPLVPRTAVGWHPPARFIVYFPLMVPLHHV